MGKRRMKEWSEQRCLVGYAKASSSFFSFNYSSLLWGKKEKKNLVYNEFLSMHAKGEGVKKKWIEFAVGKHKFDHSENKNGKYIQKLGEVN